MSVSKTNIKRAVESVRKEEMKEVKEMETEVVTETVTEEVLEEYDFEGMENLDASHKNMGSSVRGEGCLTIINHEKCGKRLHLANEIWQALGCPRYLEIFMKDKKLFVLPNRLHGIIVKFDKTLEFEDAVENYKSKLVLYSTKSVMRITEEWNLDFDDNCCFTGGVFKECIVRGKKAVVITNLELEEN